MTSMKGSTMHDNRTLWRRALAADISLTMLAVFFFAYLPPNTLNPVELTVMVGSAFSAIGVLSHAFARITLPGEHWAYLVAGLVCLAAAISYEGASLHSPVPLSTRIPFGMFLLAGSVSSLAAHVIDGGPRNRSGV